MGKLSFIFILAVIEAFAYLNASSVQTADGLNAQTNMLRIKNELRNAELEAEIGHTIMENRIKQAKNTISTHINEAKMHLKASKGWLKPNGMHIGECVSNATEEMSNLPIGKLHLCVTNALAPINNHLAELKMLEIQAEHVALYCQLHNILETSSCVQEQSEIMTKRVKEVVQTIRDDVDYLRLNTCISEVERNIFEELSIILADGFGTCIYNELVEV